LITGEAQFNGARCYVAGVGSSPCRPRSSCYLQVTLVQRVSLTNSAAPSIRRRMHRGRVSDRKSHPLKLVNQRAFPQGALCRVRTHGMMICTTTPGLHGAENSQPAFRGTFTADAVQIYTRSAYGFPGILHSRCYILQVSRYYKALLP
jgi:hypothetical protein